MAPVVIVMVIVAVIVVAVLVTRSRRSDDGVKGFRRQIDALSSDARRPTIDRGIADDDAPGVPSQSGTGHETARPVGEPGLPNGGPGSGTESEASSEAGSEAGSKEGEPDGP